MLYVIIKKLFFILTLCFSLMWIFLYYFENHLVTMYTYYDIIFELGYNLSIYIFLDSVVMHLMKSLKKKVFKSGGPNN